MPPSQTNGLDLAVEVRHGGPHLLRVRVRCPLLCVGFDATGVVFVVTAATSEETTVIYAINVADYNNPSLLSNFSVDGLANDFTLKNTRLYIMLPQGLQIVDVSDPTSPNFSPITPGLQLQGETGLRLSPDGSILYALTSMLQPAAVLDAICGQMASPAVDPLTPRHELLLQGFRAFCERVKKEVIESTDTHLPVSSMTGIVWPPNVMLLTYTELAMFFTLITSRFERLDDAEYFDGPWCTSKGIETAWTAWNLNADGRVRE